MRFPPLVQADDTGFLRDVSVIYTDIDGTFLAPGGRLLLDGDKQPSLDLVRVVLELAEAGVEVVPVTGRGRHSVSEIARLLGFGTVVAEMGSVTQRGSGWTSRITYDTGQWDHNPAVHRRPYEAIEATGVTQELVAAFPGRLERIMPFADGREVTHVFRGNVETGRAQAIVDGNDLPFVFRDNGRIHPPSHGLTLEEGEAVHVYHLMPRGVDKGTAVEADMEHRGIGPEQAVGIGDSISDVAMGLHTGSFVVMQNALEHADLLERAQGLGKPVVATSGTTSSGWVEFARVLLAQKK